MVLPGAAARPLSSQAEAPNAYAFDYRSNSKRGSVRMKFKRGLVVKNEVMPKKPYSKQHAPLRREHLKGCL